jgi:hypothetical protein
MFSGWKLAHLFITGFIVYCGRFVEKIKQLIERFRGLFQNTVANNNIIGV